MKKLIVIASVIALAFSSCGGGSVTPKSEEDSVTVALAKLMAANLKNTDSTLNMNLFCRVLKDEYKKPVPSPSNQEARMEYEQELQKQDQYLQQYFMVRVPAKALKASEEYLEKIEKTIPNIQKTESGLLYEIIEPGDMNFRAMNDQDTVKVNYEGKLKNGDVFDSSYEREEPASFPLNRVIPGWTEGMKLVGKGGKIRLWIPSDLAYGPRGSRGTIGPNEALNFEVEIIDIMPADVEEVEED